MRIADELQVDCPVFYIDNVAEHFSSLCAAGKGFDFRSIPSIAPPFADCWLEYRSIVKGVPLSFGARVVTHEWDRWAPCDCKINRTAPPTDTRWLMCLDVRGSAGIGAGPPAWAMRFAVGKDGAMLIGDLIHLEAWNGPSHDEDHDAYHAADAVAIAATMPFLLSISFMHCKNVRHVEHVPKADPKFLRATGKKPRVKFYTLEIDPMREVLRREGKVEKVGLTQALHICRGHFKDYRQSGLFGKIKGIFWWDATVRGKAEAGAVVKDYSVKAPGCE